MLKEINVYCRKCGMLAAGIFPKVAMLEMLKHSLDHINSHDDHAVYLCD